jgi:cardiolipin synthase
MSSTPNWGSTEILDALLFALQSARKTIHITQSYFIPNNRVRSALIAAAQRGVEVTIILPEHSDVRLAKSASEIFYEELLEVGVRIFERQGTMIHTKTMVIDGIWSALGSSNIDDRSFLLNYECNISVYEKEFGMAMEEMFIQDIADCKEITLENWRKRSWWKRFRIKLLTPFIKQL